ncbi:MAG: cysteine synthase family protein [Epsilonproteobacteria bacterium]|nr:cysteine synthase family protein [Campylobacterota bacterium]
MYFNTPIKKLNNIFIKLEYKNPAGSIKDRAATFMLFDAYKQGYREIIEATSGNTGIALAYYSKYFHIKPTIVMPSSYSIERQKLLKLYGANLILVKGDMNDAVRQAKEYAQMHNVYFTNQFNNPANEIAHIQTTAPEILSQVGKFDYFVAGVGSGGTLMGVAKRLKPYGVKIIAVESKHSSPIYNKLYNQSNPITQHRIQGIGAGFIPDNIDLDYIDDVVLVDDDEVLSYTTSLPNISILGGISSAANLLASYYIADKYPNAKIVTIAPDSIERYLSVL